MQKEFKTQFICEVKNFNPTDFLDRKESRKLDLFSQYAGCQTNGKTIKLKP